MFLWYAIEKQGREGFTQMVQGSLEVAAYAVEKFREKGIDAWRNENSVTVVFPRPAKRVQEKWQIAVHGEIAHIITMPNVTRALVDEVAQEVADSSDRPDTGSAR